MAIFQYKCHPGNHIIEKNALLGKALRWVVCDIHQYNCERHYEVAPRVINQDEFRQSYLNSTTKNDDLAPKCKEDVKLIHQNTGRIYVGNDTSKINMTPGMKTSFDRHGDFRTASKIDKEINRK